MHVHLLFITKYRIKGVSSRMLRPERPDLAARYLERRALVAVLLRCWFRGCTLNILKDYIRQQKTPL